MEEEVKEEVKEENAPQVTDLFGDRDEEQKPEKVEEVVEKPKEKEKEKEKEDKEPEPSEADKKVKSLVEELEKTKKTIQENQRYGRQNAQRLKNALKVAKEFAEIGALSESEAQTLFDSLGNDADIEEDASTYSTSPFTRVLKAANSELDNLRKYSDDRLLDDKIKAFDYFMTLADPEEIKDALDELNDLIDEPIKLAKKMLSIGQRYYDESYKDITESGSFHGFILKKNKQIEGFQKQIDKLNKKLSQYEDFDRTTSRINDMSEVGDSKEERRDSITDLFEERDRVKRK
jgi:CHASE3 domain sensor protein